MNRMIFRVLRADEEVEDGIQAKKPEATYRLSSFIRNGTRMKGSQFIATTTDFVTALRWANEDIEKRNVPLEKVRISVINMEMLSNCEILDMSSRESGMAVFASREDEQKVSSDYHDIALNYTVKSCEIDIVGTILPEAFRVFYLADVKKAMEYCIDYSVRDGVVNYLMKGEGE